MTTDNITLERFERDSEANKKARQESNQPRLTYDFKVLIEGEYRALLSKEVYGRGYRIYDPDHRPLRKAGDSGYPKHLGSEIGKQADFFQVVKDMLDAGLIPTIAGLAKQREREAAKAIEDDKTARQAIRDRIAQQHGPELLAALKGLLEIVDQMKWGQPWPGRPHAQADAAVVAISKAENVGEHFETAVEQELWAMRR